MVVSANKLLYQIIKTPVATKLISKEGMLDPLLLLLLALILALMYAKIQSHSRPKTDQINYPDYYTLTKPPLLSQEYIQVYEWNTTLYKPIGPIPNILNTPDPTILLSIVIPAYNEQKRLTKMLMDACKFINTKLSTTNQCELILVNDGSTDATVNIYLDFATTSNTSSSQIQFKVVDFKMNCGKGGAVASGILHAQGALILFADADGATKFSSLTDLLDRTCSPNRFDWSIRPIYDIDPIVVIGSRSHLLNSNQIIRRSWIRNLLMHAFHLILYVIAWPIRFISDTQCGFKLISRTAAQKIVPNLHIHGWIFDIELLMRAYWLNIPIAQVPVSWVEVAGSKINLVRDSIHMFVDVLVLRVMYLVRAWTV